MQGLTELNLCWNKIGDEGARHISNMQGLTVLILVWNKIGAQGVRDISNMQIQGTVKTSCQCRCTIS